MSITDQFRLYGKTALLTGASYGLGEHFAHALADAFRIALGSTALDATGPLAVLAAWAVALPFAAARTFRWE